jgi:hypothetical protein
MSGYPVDSKCDDRGQEESPDIQEIIGPILN